jgi:hypothetical protein
LYLGLSSWLLPSDFPTKILYALLISLMRVTCPAHLILLHVITLIIFGEARKLWSSSVFVCVCARARTLLCKYANTYYTLTHTHAHTSRPISLLVYRRRHRSLCNIWWKETQLTFFSSKTIYNLTLVPAPAQRLTQHTAYSNISFCFSIYPHTGVAVRQQSEGKWPQSNEDYGTESRTVVHCKEPLKEAIKQRSGDSFWINAPEKWFAQANPQMSPSQ